nr:hypothetical protein [Kibdelosporangium sp. MJ126-NF4]
MVFGGDSPPATADQPPVLQECPALKQGSTDPVNGTNCVRELQKKLSSLGYQQPMTGRFADRTEANVRAFQHSKGIAPIGIFGPKTREALLHESATPESAIPLPHYRTDNCTSQQCTLYLSRSRTRQYAQVAAERPLTVTVVSAAILRTSCAHVFKLTVATVVCHVLTDHYTQRVKNALGAAARQKACLRIRLVRPDLGEPLTFTPDNSRRCVD